jgi:arsenate reductase
MRIVIYQKPTCRQVYAALKESGVDFEAVDYYTDPIPKAKLKELLAQDETVSARAAADERTDLQNASDRPVRLDDAELIDLMVANPDLIQRPIVERGAHANLARPADRIRSFLTSAT